MIGSIPHGTGPLRYLFIFHCSSPSYIHTYHGYRYCKVIPPRSVHHRRAAPAATAASAITTGIRSKGLASRASALSPMASPGPPPPSPPAARPRSASRSFGRRSSFVRLVPGGASTVRTPLAPGSLQSGQAAHHRCATMPEKESRKKFVPRESGEGTQVALRSDEPPGRTWPQAQRTLRIFTA